MSHSERTDIGMPEAPPCEVCGKPAFGYVVGYEWAHGPLTEDQDRITEVFHGRREIVSGEHPVGILCAEHYEAASAGICDAEDAFQGRAEWAPWRNCPDSFHDADVDDAPCDEVTFEHGSLRMTGYRCRTCGMQTISEV